MLNGSEPVPQQRSSNTSHFRDAAHDPPPPPFSPPFVCVSSTLRRLLLQAEIAAPRLQLATLEGEPGTGKHLFAQALHRQSDLAHLSFRHCDAREWLANESDLSTLTGSLYLDRVDLLAPIGQGLLLNLVKTLQNEVATPRRLILLVSAHGSLRRLASQGTFLPDLAFRLTAVRFVLPPLREHREDIASIAQTLIDSICRRYQQPTAVLAQGTLPRLLQHSWPGNVRELASVLESAILDSTTGVIRPGDLALQIPYETPQPAPAGAMPQPQLNSDLSLDAAVQRHIQLVLQLNRNNKLRAARQLGISRSTLYRLLAGEQISHSTEQPS
jgi:DNA-binding NtrC family response regulator